MENEKEIMNHEMEEWKYLNEYINKMDTGYMQIISLLLAVVTGIFALAFSQDNANIKIIIFLILLVLVAVFGYMSYQFRITAILRGHLAALENSMNKKIGKNIHLWNSALVETFMAHNNGINKNLMWPSFYAVIVMLIISFKETWSICYGTVAGILIFILYWLFLVIMALIVIIPFFRNDKIRYETEDEETIFRAYQKYKLNRVRKFKGFKGIDISDDEKKEDRK